LSSTIFSKVYSTYAIANFVYLENAMRKNDIRKMPLQKWVNLIHTSAVVSFIELSKYLQWLFSYFFAAAYTELAFSKGSKENNKWPTASPGT
jgi:hypothetical protein